MGRVFLSVLLLCVFINPCAVALTLASKGVTDFIIVIDQNATSPTRTAAAELQSYLRQISGATFTIVTDAEASDANHWIFVGRSGKVNALLPQENWAALSHDGIRIKTLPNVLILAGGEPRGTLYAVYTFLEEQLGCRWWTSSESTIPRKSDLEIPELDITYTPKFLYRETYNKDPIDDPKFAARLRLNGHMTQIPADFGGHYSLLGWCHTSYELLPPGEYFAKHPDWYSEHKGKRTTDRGQLCWTNPEMQQELTRQALKRIRKNPAAGIISISQNDWLGQCQCTTCSAIDKKEGSAAGSLITGINVISAGISEKYPEFLIETLAYQYTRKPPKHLRPSTNVLVRLCSIEADFAHPLESDSNAGFRDDLLGWKAIASKLFIWNYVTSFGNYLIPHPNMLPLAADLRFFENNNVVGVFEQGDALNKLAGDFLPLRTWLLAQLMWNPNQDQTALRNTFLEGYYGPAADAFKQYLDLVNAPAKAPAFRMGCYNTDTSFLTDADLKRAGQLFDQASAAVALQPELARRVQRERLALDHVNLIRFNFTQAAQTAKENPAIACTEYDTLAAGFVERAVEMGVRNFSEAQSFSSYVPSLKARCMRYIPPVLPAAGGALPPGILDIQEDRFSLHHPGEWAEIITDGKASNGKAARMPGNHTNWAVQFPVPKTPDFQGKGSWKCFLSVRCDAKERTGIAFWYGLHDPATGAYVARDSVSLAVAGDGNYNTYGLFTDKLKPGMYFWVSPAANGNVNSIFIDRIILQKQ